MKGRTHITAQTDPSRTKETVERIRLKHQQQRLAKLEEKNNDTKTKIFQMLKHKYDVHDPAVINVIKRELNEFVANMHYPISANDIHTLENNIQSYFRKE